MALKSTIYKADLQLSDMNRNVFGDFALTIARHPSETDERVMMRVLAFALHANEALIFGKGLSTDDEPDLWLKDLTGAIELWIEVGQPDERRILKACGRSERVVVYSYGSVSGVWWDQVAAKLERAANLTVIKVPSEASREMAALAQRNMRLQCTIQDEQVWFSGGEHTVTIELAVLKAADSRRESNRA